MLPVGDSLQIEDHIQAESEEMEKDILNKQQSEKKKAETNSSKNRF